MAEPNPRDAFIKASVWNTSLDGATALLALHPELGRSDIPRRWRWR